MRGVQAVFHSTLASINYGLIDLPLPADSYSLTAQTLASSQVHLNGQEPVSGTNDEVPRLLGIRISSGPVALPPASITFLAIPDAGNASCP